MQVTVQRHPHDSLVSALDPVVIDQESGGSFQISGWAIHKHFEIREVLFGRGDEVLQRSQPCVHRPLAFKRHSSLPGAQNCGFELVHATPEEGVYWLAIAGPDRDIVHIADLHVSLRDRLQIFFMHIAKSGGSAVNRMFAHQFARQASQEHIESTAMWREDPTALENFDFLSGHLGLNALDQRLDLSRFHLVTVVRDPLDQLISHFAWIRRLASPGEESRFANHPPYVQSFANKLASHDLGSPRELGQLIGALEGHERGLVDNYQVRHFAPIRSPWVGPDDLRAARQALDRFRHIGVASDLDTFFKCIAEDMQWTPMPPTERVNVTSEFFGMDRNNPGLAEVLWPLMRFDQGLYDHILKHAKHCA